jgi:hypothetical protein
MPILGYINEGRGPRHRKDAKKTKAIKPKFLDENDKGETTSTEPLAKVFEDIEAGGHFQISFRPTGVDKTVESPVYVRLDTSNDLSSRAHNCQNLQSGLTEWLPPFMPVIVITTE